MMESSIKKFDKQMMKSSIKEFEHLIIPLGEIKLATNNFSSTHVIGSGSFGQVYKGELSHFRGQGYVMVAIKRLDRRFKKRNHELWNEILMLSLYKHENIMSLLGFCDEDGEKILVYEYASNGSLDHHLSSTALTWVQRIKICLDAASGLTYLHSSIGTHRKLIHGVIKSSNILLDENWNAKVSDAGLFKLSGGLLSSSFLISTPVASHGYCDPVYMETGVLTKECDVYSFGVLLLEVLCGKLCFGYNNGRSQIFVHLWKESYEQNKLKEIIFDDMKQQIDQMSLEKYSDIAFKCLQRAREKRPTMPHVVQELETALTYQEFYEIMKLPKDYKTMLLTAADPLNDISESELKIHLVKGNLINKGKTVTETALKYQELLSERKLKMHLLKNLINKGKTVTETALKYQELYERVKLPKDYKTMLLTAADPLNDISESELKMLFLKGILINKGKTWFSLNMDGEHCEMISIAECLTSTASESPHYLQSSEYISRFAAGCYEPFGANFKTHVRTQFLSPRITYTVNLVFKNKIESRYIGLKYKLKGELSNSYSFLSYEREDGWLRAELYQFTSDQSTVDLEIWFNTECCPTLLVEGIEFLPLKKVEHEVLTDDDKVDIQAISDNDTYWEQKLPIDYEDIIKRSKDRVQWETKKDLYYVLCKGFLISYGEEWFYLAKDGKKCLMLPARAALEEDRWEWKPENETRFEEVGDCIFDTFGIYCKFSSKMLSPQTIYAAFLVYKFPDDYESVDQPPPVQVVDEDLDSDSDSDSDSQEVNNIFLRTPQTPVIYWNAKEVKTFNPSSIPKIKGLPKQRSDGWMEVQVHEFQTLPTIKMISMCLKLSSNDMSLKGVIVLGLEFRPV